MIKLGVEGINARGWGWGVLWSPVAYRNILGRKTKRTHEKLPDVRVHRETASMVDLLKQGQCDQLNSELDEPCKQ